MPILWSPPNNLLGSQSACDYQHPEKTLLVPITDTDQETVIEKLKKRCKKFKDNVLPAVNHPHKDSMIRAANFLAKPIPSKPELRSVLDMIQQNEDILHIRVYYGVDENGEHVFFMVPIREGGMIIEKADTIFLDNCCHCPPMSNCPNDQLL
jgi:hypothetical protein